MNLSGLFGSAYRALDPVLPFDGLLDPRFASIPRGPSQASTVVPFSPVPQAAPVGAPAQAPVAPVADAAPKAVPHVSPWRVIDRVLGKHQTFSDAIDAERARPQQEVLQAKMQAFASRLPEDQQMLFYTSPQKWAETYANQHNPKVVGDALWNGSEWTYPDKFTQNDGVYGVQTHDGWREVGRAPHIVNVPNSATAVDVNAPPAGGQGAGRSAPQGGFDQIYAGFVAPHEGGYTPSDGNGAPANFGINQKANPDLDVAHLTPATAKQVYLDRYWKPSGADQLPPALQAVHFDTAVNMGLGAAKQLLDQSQGDPQRYLALREQRYRAIAQADPSKADRLPNWLKRNADLAAFAGGQGAAQPGGAGAPGAAGRVVFQNATNADGLPDLQGEELLKALPPAEAKVVKALAEGRMAFPSGAALRSPYWAKMLSAVGQYDPNFDAVNYNARAATRRDFTSGASSKNLTSFNTAIGHLDELDKAIDGLGNYPFKLNNQVANYIAVHTGDGGRVKRFELARNAVADELTRAFRGAGGTGEEVQAWKHTLDAADSPDSLHTAVKEAVHLLHSRIEALGEQYNKGMGTTKDPLELLTPKAASAMARLAGLPEPQTAADVAQEVAAPPPPPTLSGRGPGGRSGPPANAPRKGTGQGQAIRTASGVTVHVQPIG